MGPKETQHRRDIDGLRAIAVLSVLVYHAFPDLLTGGFVGVDIFFVISGYLIGGILLRGLDAGTFSFVDFYARRIRRIFPALIIVLACSLVAGWLLMLPDEYRSLAEQAGAGAAFFANILLWAQTNYFDAYANMKPLLHLWSLGVEEQFYIVWPVILVVAYRLRLNVLTVTLLLAAASFGMNIYFVHDDPTGTFYLPHTRFWELLAGCLLAYTELRHAGKIDSLVSRVIFAGAPREQTLAVVANLKALMGATVIAYAITQLSSADLFPGWRAVLPVVGAALLLSAGERSFLNRYLLGSRPMVWIGLISYPLYLWHWPLLSFARIDAQHPVQWRARIVLLAVSFLLAALTYLLVEKRVRHRRHILVPGVLALVMALVAGQAFATYRANGFPSRTARFQKVEAAVGEWDYPTKDMTISDFEGVPIRSRTTPNKATALFIGDSNMEQYWPRFDQLVTSEPQNVKSVVFATIGGCPPIPGVEEPLHPFCENWTEKVKRYVAQNPNIDSIYVAAYWLGYMNLVPSYRIDAGSGMVSTTSDAGRAAAIKSLMQMLVDYQKMGKKVTLVLNSPVSGAFDPRSLVGRSLFGFSIKEGGMHENDLLFETTGLKKQMLAAATAAGISTIDPTRSFCKDGFCSAWVGDEPMYRDSAHLRASFVRNQPSFVDETILIK